MIQVKEFFDQKTWTLTYIVWDSDTKDAVIIDPVFDYDPASSKVTKESAELLVEFITKLQLKPIFVLETHAHADHISGAQVLKEKYPLVRIGIGKKICEVQKTFKNFFGLHEKFLTDGSQFDFLLEDNQEISAGSIKIKTIFTPGHTPACVSFLIDEEHLFVGDALFMPDYGTGRCDFPGGSAKELYHSIYHRLYQLPEKTKVYTGHDYLPGNRALRFVSTIAEERQKNIHLSTMTSEEEFIKMRQERDRSLAAPRLLLPSVQVNIDAGHLPVLDQNGKRFLKIPIG